MRVNAQIVSKQFLLGVNLICNFFVHVQMCEEKNYFNWLATLLHFKPGLLA